MADEETAINETIEHLGEVFRRARPARRLMLHRTPVDATNFLRLEASPSKRGDSF